MTATEPSSAITMSSFYQAGGVSAVLKTLLRDVPLFKDSIGVTLKNTSEVVRNSYVDENIIHPYKQKFQYQIKMFFLLKTN